MRGVLAALAVSLSVWFVAAPSAQTPVKADKVDVVAVVGCLRENAPNTWTLTSATDPAPSNANAPLPKEIASAPRAGKNEFRLIGVAEFNLPSHRDHMVMVKGLHVKASPTSRLNVTSVTMVAASCDPSPKVL